MCFLLFLIKNNYGCSIRVYGLYLNEIEKINVFPFPVASCPNIWEHDIISNLCPSAQHSNYFTVGIYARLPRHLHCLQHGMCFSGVLFDWLKLRLIGWNLVIFRVILPIVSRSNVIYFTLIFTFMVDIFYPCRHRSRWVCYGGSNRVTRWFTDKTFLTAETDFSY
jgi:hypothetical protein